MAVYDNTYNPYGDTQFNTLKDYQTWMKTGLANKGINTPWFKVDGKMGPKTATAMNMVTNKGLVSPQVQSIIPTDTAKGTTANSNVVSNKAGQPSVQYGLAINPNQSYTQQAYDYGRNAIGLSDGTGSAGTYTYAPYTAEDGTQMAGGTVGLNTNAIDAIQNPYISDGTALDFSNASKGLWGDIGGAKGLADIGGGLASLYSIYSGMQQNKRAEDAWNMQKQEYNRSVQKDRDFASALNKSGLGTYSAG